MRHQRLLSGAKIGVAALMLFLFCVVSGRPILYPDTKAYFALGQEIGKIVGIEAGLGRKTAGNATDISLRGRSMSPAERAVEERLAYTVAGTRSPYFSAYLFFGYALGGMWLIVMLQSLFAAAVLWVATRILVDGRGYLAMMAVLAVASSLPIYTMFVMADIFAGLGIVAAILLIAFQPRIARPERIFLFSVVAIACLFHPSHLLVIGSLGALAAIAALIPAIRRPGQRTGAGLVLAGAVIGVFGMVAYPAAVKALRGETIYSPPFLSARLIADGPGRTWLRTHCRAETEPFYLCRFRNRPLTNTDEILWDTRPRIAVFQASDYAGRVRIITEQPAFLHAVFRSDPGGVLGAIGRHIRRLMFDFTTDEPLKDPTPIFRDPEFRLFAVLVRGGERCRSGAASCAHRITPETMNLLVHGLIIVSIATITMLLVSRRVKISHWRTLILLLLAALFLNAVICATLSGPAPRYQSRLGWLIPATAMLMLATVRRRRPTSAAEPLSPSAA